MAYILEPWDILISTTIHPDRLSHFSNSENWHQTFIQESESEMEKLRTLLVKDFVDGAEQKKMEFLVQFNQGILIRLLDKLYQYRSSPVVSEKAILLYESISIHVRFILDFIEEYFTKYFDRNEKVPFSYLIQSKEEILRQLKRLQQLFVMNKAPDSFLTDLIRSNFINFCKDEKTLTTYTELIYQKELVKELLSLPKPGKNENFQKALEEKLICMNFNSTTFTDYLLNQLNIRIEQATTSKYKMATIASFRRSITLICLRPSVALCSNCPNVKETILNIIDKEFHSLQDVPEKQSSPVASEKALVHVQFRGTEIYLFHKAFIDAGGAPGETYKSILEKTAAYLSNKTKKGFSVESLQKNSDKVDYESKENLKRFLTKMIRNIDSY